jgi:APA family basic amino acid/polyamine antiporter
MATQVGADKSASPSPRAIGFWMAVALVMGNMIGSGIFLLPASLAPYGGVSLIGWLVSAGGALLLALVFARLARLDPLTGGPYAYSRCAFGDLAGFIVAWGYWISMWSTLGALAVAFVGYLEPFFPHLVRTPPLAAATAIATVWLLIAVNIAGVRQAGWLQSATTVLKVMPLVGVGLVGLFFVDAAHFAVPQDDVRALASSIPAVVTLTLWAFLGLESATVPSESIENPSTTIPRATMVGTILTAAIYIGSSVAVLGLLSADALGRSTAPFADAARLLGGERAAQAVALGAALSCFGALNGWALLVGQLPMAAARDGLFPPIFARTTRQGTPAAGLLIAGVLATVLIALNYTRGLVALFTFIILLSTLNTLVPYVFCSLAVFILGEPADRSGRLIAGGKVTAAGAFLYSLYAVGGAGAETVYWGFLLILSGLPIYVRMLRSRTRALPSVDSAA